MIKKCMGIAWATVLTLSITACGGETPQASTAATNEGTEETQSEVQVTDESSEANDSTSTSSSSEGFEKSNSSQSEDVDSYHLGSIATGVADDEGNPTITEATAHELFTITLDGETYQLPCAVQELYDHGWAPTKSFESAAQEMIPSHTGPAGVGICRDGNEDDEIVIATYNPSASEAPLAETYVKAMYIDPQSSTAKFMIGVGVGSDSSFEELEKTLGYRSGTHDYSESRVEYHLDLFGEDAKTEYGRASYAVYSEDKSVASLDVSLGFNLANPLYAPILD